MVKKCIVCNEQAQYKIKDTSDYYCTDCAKENFSDLQMLMTLEAEAQRLKQFMQNPIHDDAQDNQTGQDHNIQN